MAKCMTKSKKKADSNDTNQKLVSMKVREDGSKAITGIRTRRSTR